MSHRELVKQIVRLCMKGAPEADELYRNAPKSVRKAAYELIQKKADHLRRLVFADNFDPYRSILDQAKSAANYYGDRAVLESQLN